MPNRIIKESITTSEKLASLSDFEFRLWIGLITQADDAGRGDARPAVIKGRVFPFRERLTVKDVGCSLRALADKGCIALYEIDGRSYFYTHILYQIKNKSSADGTQNRKKLLTSACDGIIMAA